MTESNHLFPGFSIPEGAWSPPELMDILPEINTKAELKVTIAAIHETLRVGVVEAVISLSDFEALTGMARSSVSRGIKAALDRGTFKRQQVGNIWLYRLHFRPATSQRGSSVLLPSDGSVSLPNQSEMLPNQSETLPNQSETLPHVVMHDSDQQSENIQQQQQRAELVAKMRQLGVALRVAQEIVAKYDHEYLLEKLEQTLYAVEAGIAENGPGWFVCSVREDWQQPLGYRRKRKPKTAEEERQERRRYIEGKYADLIEH